MGVCVSVSMCIRIGTECNFKQPLVTHNKKCSNKKDNASADSNDYY